MKIVDKQNIFNAGIISTKLNSRDDLKHYNNGVADAFNFICSRYGPIEKRVGTKFIWDLGNPGEDAFFLPFVFSITQSVLLEFLANRLRFYTFDGVEFGPIADPGAWVADGNYIFTANYTPVLGDGTYFTSDRTNTEKGANIDAVADDFSSITVEGVTYKKAAIQYEISTPFTRDQLNKISYVQSFDVIYMAFSDGKTAPYTLSRYANNNWKLAKFETEDGPYLDKNYATSKKMTIKDKNTDESTIELTNFTLADSAPMAPETREVSGVVPEMYRTPDVGRWIRINTPRYNENTYSFEDKWSYGKITAVEKGGNVIHVKWSYRNIVEEEDQAWMMEPTSEWRLGVWHVATGNPDYPVTYPKKVSIHQQRLVWAGMTNKPWVWMSNSYAYNNYAPSDYDGNIAATNAINVDISTDKVSEIFWVKSVKSLLIGTELGEIRMYSAGTGLAPADCASNRESSYGAYNGEPIVTDDMVIFIQRLQRTLRSLSYDYNQDAYVGPELTIFAEHLTTGGIKKIVYQKEPNNTIWCLKEDSTLLTLTYDKAQEVIGWSRSSLAGKNVKVIDLAVLPSNEYQQDMVLMILEREVDGKTVRYLELLSQNFIEDVEAKDADFLDCSIRISNEEPFTTVSGMEHLEGETVRVMEEGAYVGDYVIEDGMLKIDVPVKDIVVGLPYEAYFDTLERDFGDKTISTKLAKLRVFKIKLYVVRTLGLSLCRLDRGSISELITFDPTKNTDNPPSLLTGLMTVDVASAWDCDYRLRIKSEPGMPCTVSGIVQGVEINAL